MKLSEIFEGENSGLIKAFDYAVHIGGESKEEIEAEDGWHDEQMTYTDKRLEEFDREFVKDCGPDVEPIFIYAVGSVGPIRQFIAESIQQAIAEDRERMVEEIEKYDQERIGKYLEDRNNKKSSNEVVLDILSILRNHI